MAGIYLHIPFCKQACHYCDFHFSTSLKYKPQLVQALCTEIELRKEEAKTPIQTIYFGGGTPSLLSDEELKCILDAIYENYEVEADSEITLEANPDDLSPQKLKQLAHSSINRLSIGIQSFYEEDLIWMNRSHSADQAEKSIQNAQAHFENISIDLIYGVPGMSDAKWQKNLEKAVLHDLPHISSYALTVEPATALDKMIRLGKKEPVKDEQARRQYEMLVDYLSGEGFVNYEFSNFGKPGYFSRNNTAYWSGKPYIGIGPSAHGFDGKNRYWNLRHNIKYIDSIAQHQLPSTQETLSTDDRYNEYIMTRLRTMWGISLQEIKENFGEKYRAYLVQEIDSLLRKGWIYKEGDHYKIKPEAKFFGDGISSELFYID